MDQGGHGWELGASSHQAALLLIRMYCFVAVDLSKQTACNIAIFNFLRSVAPFEFDSITPSLKAALACNTFSMPHSLDGREPFQYASAPGPPAIFPRPSKSPYD